MAEKVYRLSGVWEMAPQRSDSARLGREKESCRRGMRSRKWV